MVNADARPEAGDRADARSSTVMSITRRLTLPLAVLVAIGAGLYALDSSPVGVYYDDAHYVLLGKALATGQGYRYLNLPDAPHATHYPPGYPLVLAILWRIAPEFPRNVVAFKLANVALLALIAVGTLRFARRRLELEEGAALAVVVAAVATVPMLFLTTMLLSEPFFAALLLPVLLAAEEIVDRPVGESSPIARAALLGAAAGALTLVRTHGIVLAPAITLVMLAQHRRREAVVVLASSVLVMAPWLLWVAHYDVAFAGPLRGNYGSYTSWLVEGVRERGLPLIAGTSRRNVEKIINDSALYLQLGRNGFAHVVAMVALVIASVAGARALRRRAPVTLTFLALYLALVIIWPFWPMRFVFGVWPLVVVIVAAGVRDAVREATASGLPRARRLATLTAGTLLVAGLCWSHAFAYSQRWWSSLARANARPLLAELAWVVPHTRPEQVVGTVNQPAVFLYTGRLAVPISAFTPDEYLEPRSTAASAESMRALMRLYPPDVVIATTPDTWSATASLAAMPGAPLTPFDTLSRVGIAYRRTRVAVAAPRGTAAAR